MSKYLVLIFQDEVATKEVAGETVSADYQAFMQRRGGLCSAGPHSSRRRRRRPSGATGPVDSR
jgi:hypothetical protein